jgi:hypothetical protein
VIRRTFRIGLRLGALAGIAYAVSKVLQGQRNQSTSPAPWKPAADLPSAPPPPAPRPRPAVVKEPEPAPVVEPEPEAVAEPEPEVAEPAGEPAPEPGPEPAPEPEAKTTAPKLPSPPPAPEQSDDFNLPRVRPSRPAGGSRDTLKRPATARTAKRTSTRTSVAAKAWVEPSGQVCPPSHPVKAKKTSFLYHLPGMAAYDRTKPDRCYRDERAARADGFLPAKR